MNNGLDKSSPYKECGFDESNPYKKMMQEAKDVS